MNVKKLKPYLVTGGIALGAFFVMNTLANRFQIARDLRDRVTQGI